MSTSEFDQIISYRNGVVENTHIVHAAVVDSMGRILRAIGDADRVTLLRSAAKPAQSLAILETGAFEMFPFDNADLALINASHSSEEIHVTATNKMLAKVDRTKDQLQCGGHPALSKAVNDDWTRRGIKPEGLHNNCSGKHVGMLTGALSLRLNTDDYHLPSHPLQKHVMSVVESLSETPVTWALDGCNLPTPAFSLRSFARMYSAFASVPDDYPSIPNSRSTRMARIYEAMHTYPELVAGSGRFDTRLMTLCGDRLTAKVGADACFGIGVKPSEATRKLGATGGIGIAVKIEDGDEVALYSALVELLGILGIISEAEQASLVELHRPLRTNSMGIVVGTVQPNRSVGK